MSKVLDLSVFSKETLDIKLPDSETTLHLRKPTRDMTIRLMSFQNLQNTDPAEVVVERMDSMVLDILNTNDVDRQFDLGYVVNVLSTGMKVAVIQAYAALISNFETDPN